jgi:hypothetical protein
VPQRIHRVHLRRLQTRISKQTDPLSYQ